jgi:Xaa-Pro aminopeptidase
MNFTELPGRRKRLLERLPELNAEVLLVGSPSNIRYLSGFTGSNALLLVAAGETTLFTDPRYTIQSREEADCRVSIVKGPLYEGASKLISRRKWRTIGVEQGRITYAAYIELGKHFPMNASVVPVPPVVEQLRMIKSESELASIRRSVITNSTAFDKVVSRLKATSTENDVAAELEYQMRRLGAEKAAFETIVAAGERSALPHAQPTCERIRKNRLLLIDMGAVQAGYCSDMTRMLHLGQPGAKARKLHKAVLEAQLAAINAVRENTTATAVDRAARQVLKTHGFNELFVHSTGHGLGLEIHEPPRVGKRDKTPLKAGMVITIEPGAYMEGFGGVRIEDTVVVTKTGCEVLTPTRKELLVV